MKTQPEPDKSAPPAWSQERRLRFLDFRLKWDATLNRRDLTDTFGISVPQASKDIGRYVELWGEDRLVYDKSNKNYVAGRGFKAAYPTSSAKHYFAQLLALDRGIVSPRESALGFRPPVDVVPVPTRAADEEVVQALVRAIRDQRCLEIDYQSITRDEAQRRPISPHAFAYDGLRWHVRAYCHQRNAFRDFVIGRILSTGKDEPATVQPQQDDEWNRILMLILTPHPSLGSAQRKGVECDYEMTGGRCELKCRQAMLYYVLRTLHLDAEGNPVAGVKQVAIENLADIKPFLPTPGQR